MIVNGLTQISETCNETAVNIEVVLTISLVTADGVGQIPIHLKGAGHHIQTGIITAVQERTYTTILTVQSQADVGIEAITKFQSSDTAKVVVKRTETEIVILAVIQTTHKTHEPCALGGHIHILVLHRNNGILCKRCHRHGHCCKENKNFFHMVKN